MTLGCMTLCRTVSNCDETCASKFANLVVTSACCSCPAGVNLVCVVGTTLSPPAVSAATGIHVSVTVHYLLYSGRCEHRVGDAPETVASDTGVRRGSCGWSLGILHPSSLSLFWFPSASSFSFFWGLLGFFISWGLQP